MSNSRKFEECFIKFHNELKNSMKEINSGLRKIEQLSFEEFSEVFEGKQSGLIGEILKQFSKSIYNVYCKVFHTDINEMFFWNGYTCIDGKKRLTIKTENQVKCKLFVDSYETGIGFYREAGKTKEFFHCPNSYWYNALLNSAFTDSDKIKFPPPSTNSWMSTQHPEKHPQFILRDNGDENTNILQCLSFHYERKNDVEVKDGRIEISIKEKDLRDGLQNVDHYINEERKKRFENLDDESFIEYAMRSDHLYNECDKDKNRRSSSDIDSLKKLQHHVYSIWYASAFNFNIINELIIQKKHEIEKKNIGEINTKELYAHIEKFFNNYEKSKNEIVGFREVDYKHWYNLFIDNYSKENELGTFM
ncbi:MAG: hypothetical protein K9J24_09850, partial [Bacteroidales bacterium]|nr:hypothetical protein [Bacteroidales bacterium]